MDTKLVLHRYPQYFGGTPGELVYDGKFVCYTLERPWVNNENNVSCIPLGSYPLAMTMSNRFKKVLPLVDKVPDRSGIRIHGANVVSELHGCIAPVSQLIIQSGKLFGAGSQVMVKKVIDIINTNAINVLSVVRYVDTPVEVYLL